MHSGKPVTTMAQVRRSTGRSPASYLLQWRAIQDALKRGDSIYNFWGIAPPALSPDPLPKGEGGSISHVRNHPFAG